MRRYRLTAAARADLNAILSRSREQFGEEARRRYAALLTAAIRSAAADPLGSATMDRSDLLPGLRSLHIRHARSSTAVGRVGEPVHMIFFRIEASGTMIIVRLLHERMDPGLHVR